MLLQIWCHLKKNGNRLLRGLYKYRTMKYLNMHSCRPQKQYSKWLGIKCKLNYKAVNNYNVKLFDAWTAWEIRKGYLWDDLGQIQWFHGWVKGDFALTFNGKLSCHEWHVMTASAVRFWGSVRAGLGKALDPIVIQIPYIFQAYFWSEWETISAPGADIITCFPLGNVMGRGFFF